MAIALTAFSFICSLTNNVTIILLKAGTLLSLMIFKYIRGATRALNLHSSLPAGKIYAGVWKTLQVSPWSQLGKKSFS